VGWVGLTGLLEQADDCTCTLQALALGSTTCQGPPVLLLSCRYGKQYVPSLMQHGRRSCCSRYLRAWRWSALLGRDRMSERWCGPELLWPWGCAQAPTSSAAMLLLLGNALVVLLLSCSVHMGNSAMCPAQNAEPYSVMLWCCRQYTSESSVVLPQTKADAVALSALVRALAKTDRWQVWRSPQEVSCLCCYLQLLDALSVRLQRMLPTSNSCWEDQLLRQGVF